MKTPDECTSMQELWESYGNMAISDGASITQIRETKRALYAGMTAMLNMTIALTDPEINLPEQEAAERIQGWFVESEAFIASITAGVD